jgi:hypothetical protein
VQEPSPAGDATETRSPEEIEAIWKNRVSQKDRAHAAEAKALRERAEAAEAKAARTAEAEAEGSSDADQWKAKYEASQKAVEQERTERLIEVREAKYPMAAEALEPEVLAKMDEGKLAALNARLDDGEPAPSGRIDPNAAPRRTPSPPTSPRDKSVAELEADLKRYGPGYVNQIHGE